VEERAFGAYQRRTLAADVLIASAYLAKHQHTARPSSADHGVRGAVGKDMVSRV
jgi:hypothetical protein